MRVNYLLPFIFLISACTSAPSIRGPAATDTSSLWGLNLSDIPEGQLIKSWGNPKYEDSSAPKIETLAHIGVSRKCSDKRLYPTHPQQNSKIYHLYRNGHYDYAQVPVESRVCKIKSSSASPVCQRADTFSYAVISDIYTDACGNIYRGIWNRAFLKQDDTMGTLFSKGRKMYQKENSKIANDMEDGGTDAQDQSDFLFLTHAFPGDEEIARDLAAKAMETHTFDPKSHLFHQK